MQALVVPFSYGFIIQWVLTMAPHFEHSDEELIADYLRGDEAAFGVSTGRHLSGVYSFALRLVGDSAAAEDIAQETFVKAWRSLKKYDSKTSRFKTWVLRIARNTAIDFLRKKKNIPIS